MADPVTLDRIRRLEEHFVLLSRDVAKLRKALLDRMDSLAASHQAFSDDLSSLRRELERLKVALPVHVVDLPYRGGYLLNGMIARLTNQCQGNVAKRGVVAVTASSDYRKDPLVNAVDPQS
jgi:hypothetical protein